MLPTSDRARQAVLNADQEARTLHHSYVGTEHLLLGLLREQSGAAAGVLASLGVTHAGVRAAVVRMMGVGIEAPAGELPLTDAAQAAIDRAGREASALGADSVGTDHILLALTRDPGGAAARILTQMDADPETIRSTLAA